ncbi:MAG TPA: preprotein translocase subunit YajC [Rhodothermales bacterium]|nr:preprotein translocase subunit YajC [Rhodothermales bacterium]
MDFFLMGAPPGSEGSALTPFIFMAAIFAVFYFLLIRPQKKKEQERKQMIEELKKGDNIVTVGGLYGKVVQVDDTSVLAQVDEGTKVRIDKNAISSLRS